MEPVVLFRAGLAEEEEMERCKKYFPVLTQRSHIGKDQLIIPRYSALPWYEEFQNDVEYLGGQLINTFAQHNYVANLRNWYYDLGDITPRTWFYIDQLPKDGPFVLKGQTNSKKHMWNTHMFAKDKTEAIEVFSRLLADGYVGYQQIYAREYVKLKEFTKGIQGLPITEEYRFFILDGQIVSSGFYWSEHTDYIKENFDYVPNPDIVPKNFLQKIIDKVKPKIRFFVADVALTASGDWILIELNDGSMSGLSDNDPDILYSNMRKILK